MAVRIQLRRDTSSNWSLNNPILRPGELGIETDTLKFKIGPAVESPAIGTAWNSITDYANVVPSDLNSTLNDYLLTTDLGVTVAELVDGNIYVPGNDIIFEGTNADAYEITLSTPEATADRTISFPDVDGTVITSGDTGSVTNAMLAGSIENAKLTNSSVTINTNSLSLGGSLTLDTDDVSEGTSNKYFTDERAQDAIATAFSNGTHTNITITYNDNDNAISIAAAPGYTDEQAQDAVGNAVGNGLDYDDNTGAISVDPSEFALSAVGVPTGDVSLNSHKITNLAAPTSANDAANKAYVDNTTAGLNFHASVHCASTANLTATYDNGTGGVGATLTNTGTNEALTLDNHVLEAGERVLIKDQTSQAENGIYLVTTVGDESTPWVLTRATDADNSPSGEVAYGDFTFVQQGTNGGYGYILTTTGTITIGTTSLVYTVFNAGQTVIAGNGLSETTPGTLAIDTAVTVDLNTAQTLTNKIITGTFTGNLTGNADTVTNGVYTNADNTITAASASTKPLIIKGAASQTANLQEWQNSSGTVKSRVSSSGNFHGDWAGLATIGLGAASAYVDSVALRLIPNNASTVGAIIRGATSQSADLQQWQNSAGTVLMAVTSSGAISTGTWNGTAIGATYGGTGLTSYATGDVLYASDTNTLSKLAAGTNGYLLTMVGGVPAWAAAPVSLPSQTGNNGKYLTTDGTDASWAYLPITTGTATITTNTATTVDTLSTEVAAEYTLCISQGIKIRTSKVIVNADHVATASADMTEFAITETNGTISGVLVSVAYGSGAELKVTVTDAASENATVKFTRVTF